ncbi:TPA: cyclophane-containing peptide 2OG-Fe(II) oxygenase YhhC [Neisseria lactamica]
MKINTNNIQCNKIPFPHAFSKNFLDGQQAKDILEWLEIAPWHLTVTDFYSQYEFLLDIQNVPKNLQFLISDETKQRLKNLMENLFSCRLKDTVEIVAHRLLDNQIIKIHNDYIEEADFEAESHRLLIQLNHGWSADNGGYLMIFNSKNPQDIANIILLEHRSMFAFEISKESHHAVSKIYSGCRYTLIFNFYRII